MYATATVATVAMMHRRLAVYCFIYCFLLSSESMVFVGCRPQFVEFSADYKKNHIEDEIKYTFQYYIDHVPSNVHFNHREERRGSQVNGQYGLLEPGGLVRHVHYQVDGANGFRSVVRTQTPSSRTHQLFQLPRNQPLLPVQHAQPVAYVL